MIADLDRIAEVVLNGPGFSGIRLTTDPGQCVIPWPTRRAIYSGPGGWTLVQDSDNTVGDCGFELSSTETTPMSRDCVVDLMRMKNVIGQQWSYVDSLGNECMVVIIDFQSSYRGSGFFDYALKLQVRSATTILGSAALAAGT